MGESKFFETNIQPYKMKRTMMGRYFNVVFFLRLGMFEVVMASTQPFPML